MNRALEVTYRTARRIAIAIIGTTVVLMGVAMLVLPGPGLLTIALGLMVLGIEFAFARRWLARIKSGTRKAAGKALARVGHKGPAGGHDGPDNPME